LWYAQDYTCAKELDHLRSQEEKYKQRIFIGWWGWAWNLLKGGRLTKGES